MSAAAVVVTGTGMITPVGTDTDSTWDAIRRGESRAGLAPTPGVSRDLQCRTVAPFGAELLPGRGTANLDPFVRFALVAADQAISEAGLDPATWDGSRVGIVVGCGLGGAATLSTAHSRLAERGPDAVSPYVHPRSLINMAAGMIAIRHHVTGPGHTVVAACASGAVAVGVGRDLIRSGACDIVIAVGTDAGVVPVIAAGFAAMGALTDSAAEDASRPFAADRSGFVLSEGAARPRRAASSGTPSPPTRTIRSPRTPMLSAPRRPYGPRWRTPGSARRTWTTSMRMAPPPRTTTVARQS